MKKTLIFIITIFTMSTLSYSQIKFGVINAQNIMEKSKIGQQIQRDLEAIQQNKQSQLKQMQDSVQKLEKELLSPSLNAETRENKSIELETKRNNLKRYYEDAEREFRMESQKELAALEKELIPLIDNYARTNDFTIVFDITRPGIVYFDQAIDITNDIINIIDAR